MVTLKDLSNLRDIDAEIREIKTKILELRTAAEKGTADITGQPRGGNVTDRVGTIGALLADYETMLTDAVKKKIRESKRIHEFILSVDDAQTRRIMQLRYIDGKGWQGVANQIGGNTAASVRMRVIRYMESIEKGKRK